MKMYKITSRDRCSVSRLFIFAFERFQVVGGLVVAWSGAEEPSSNGRKHCFEMGSLQSEPSEHPAGDLHRVINDV